MIYNVTTASEQEMCELIQALSFLRIVDKFSKTDINFQVEEGMEERLANYCDDAGIACNLV